MAGCDPGVAPVGSDLLQIIPLYLALSQLLQQHQFGFFYPQLLLQLLNDALPLRGAALLRDTPRRGGVNSRDR